MPDFSFADDGVIRRLLAMYESPDMVSLRGFILDRLAPQKGDRVLDIGCGPGVTLCEIARRVGTRAQAVGIDLSEGMLEEALKRSRGQNLTNVEIHHGDVQKLPFPNGSFDAVLCVQVLEYCTDPGRVLDEALRVLRPDGRIVFADTDWDTTVYHSKDKALTRRIVAAWSDHDADGWLGRRLLPMFHAAKVGETEHHAYVVVNDRYTQPLMGWTISRLIGDYVVKSGRVPKEEVDRWHADLEAQDTTGQYLFSVNRYICTGRKS